MSNFQWKFLVVWAYLHLYSCWVHQHQIHHVYDMDVCKILAFLSSNCTTLARGSKSLKYFASKPKTRYNTSVPSTLNILLVFVCCVPKPCEMRGSSSMLQLCTTSSPKPMQRTTDERGITRRHEISYVRRKKKVLTPAIQAKVPVPSSSRNTNEWHNRNNQLNMPSPSEYAVLLAYGELSSLYRAIFSRWLGGTTLSSRPWRIPPWRTPTRFIASSCKRES